MVKEEMVEFDQTPLFPERKAYTVNYNPQATVNVTLEITAEFPNGVSETTKWAVSENATSLGFKNKT
jgi:hypothetical protein